MEKPQGLLKTALYPDVEILRNILYRGVWTKYQKIQKERQESQEKNGK